MQRFGTQIAGRLTEKITARLVRYTAREVGASYKKRILISSWPKKIMHLCFSANTFLLCVPYLSSFYLLYSFLEALFLQCTRFNFFPLFPSSQIFGVKGTGAGEIQKLPDGRAAAAF